MPAKSHSNTKRLNNEDMFKRIDIANVLTGQQSITHKLVYVTFDVFINRLMRTPPQFSTQQTAHSYTKP